MFTHWLNLTKEYNCNYKCNNNLFESRLKITILEMERSGIFVHKVEFQHIPQEMETGNFLVTEIIFLYFFSLICVANLKFLVFKIYTEYF